MAILSKNASSLSESSQLVLVSIALLALLLVIVARHTWHAFSNPLNAVPGPWSAKWTNLPLKIAVITGRRMYYVHELHQRYGLYVRIAPNEVSVSDPDAFSQIHKIGSGFVKSNWYMDLVGFERPTLFTMTDARAHGIRRKLLARAFSKTYLRQNWEPVVHRKVRVAVERMKEESKREGSTNILKWWTLMATDVATHLMFGESFRMIEQGQKTEYIRKLEVALKGGGIGAELPLVRSIGKHLPFPVCKDLFAANRYILSKAEIAVTNAKAGGEKNLFAHIIAEGEKGGQIDDLDVKLEASALIVAGSDTTAVTVTYLVWAVLSQPGLARNLQRELGNLGDGYSEKDLEHLPLLNAVIEETLRLYGAAPGGTPRSVPSGGVSMGGHFIPSGTTVTTQAYTLHRDEKIFHDPLRFDHTRWLSTNHGIDASPVEMPLSELTKTIFSPFGAGSRICMGIHLARMELRLAAAEFFRQCDGAKLAQSTTEKSMEMENFFLIAPKSHKCDVIC